MIRYNPPKSQVWGHQVGRFAAAVVVERALRFLDEQSTIIASQPSELTLAWTQADNLPIDETVSEVDGVLGAATYAYKTSDVAGRTFRQLRWPFRAEKLPNVAIWFDRLAEFLATGEVVAQSSTFWIFAWRDEVPPLRPLESPGGMFGVHLGRPHRITTTFSFRDIERYSAIKAYLARLDLVELSDRHLTPKTVLTTGKRRAK